MVGTRVEDESVDGNAEVDSAAPADGPSDQSSKEPWSSDTAGSEVGAPFGANESEETVRP